MPEAGSKTQAGLTFRTQPHVDHELARLAAKQYAVFSVAQVCSVGLTPSAVRQRTASGRLHRVYHSVYSLVPPQLLGREGRLMAAALACGEGAVISHRSAALLHELRPSDRSKLDVTVPRRGKRKHRGIDLHRSTTLTPDDAIRVNGIPCTTIARTLLDLGEILSRRQLERAFDQAEVMGALNLLALEAVLERNPTRRGAHNVRAVLAEHYIGQTPTWSELEEAFLAVTRGAGLPDPEVNAWIDPGDGEPPIRADFVWRAQLLIVETDGHKYHRTRQAFERDRRNDQRLARAGWRPIRTTWHQIVHRPGELRATLVALMNL